MIFDTLRIDACTSSALVCAYCINPNATPNTQITNPIYSNVTPLTSEARRRLNIPARLDGLLVTEVDENSPFADRLAPDVLILQIDRADIRDIDTARQALTPGRHMLFVYFRGALRVVGINIE